MFDKLEDQYYKLVDAIEFVECGIKGLEDDPDMLAHVNGLREILRDMTADKQELDEQLDALDKAGEAYFNRMYERAVL